MHDPLPWGEAPLALALPPCVRTVLAHPAVIALRTTTHHQQWRAGVEICVQKPAGGPHWIAHWRNILALPIPGLAEALLALQQPHPAAAQAVAAAWARGTGGHAAAYSQALHLSLSQHGAWVGIHQPDVDLKIRLHRALDHARSPNSSALSRRATLLALPLAQIATVLTAPAASAHAAVRARADAHRLNADILAALPLGIIRPTLAALCANPV